MKKIILMSILFSTGELFAFSTACNLKNQLLPAVSINEADKKNYYSKLDLDCKLEKEFQSLTSKGQKIGVDLSEITEFQALRYIRRADFNEGIVKNKPVEKIYQINKTDYNKPINEQNTIIWDNFIKGIAQKDTWVEKIKAGKVFSVIDLQAVHLGFFPKPEDGDYSHKQDAGVFKKPNDNDTAWWSFKTPEETQINKKIIAELNENYKRLSLIDRTKDSRLFDVLRIKDDSIYCADSRVAANHVHAVLQTMNSFFMQGLSNEHLVASGQLLTPTEAAYLIQQFYVQVHPFVEGNGRTSRFMQELILSTFSQPPGSSGDLMDFDVLTTNKNYHQLANEAQKKALDSLNNCFNEYSQNNLNTKEKLILSNSKLSYGCRILEKIK